MTALEEDKDGPGEAYKVLTNGACALKPLVGDVPKDLSPLVVLKQIELQVTLL